MYPAYMRSSVEDGVMVVLWHTGNYKYQIEIVDCKTNKGLETINYHDKPYEYVSEEFEKIALAPMLRRST